MELSKQVVSLELAKRLKELGVKQDSLFYWQGTEKLHYVINFEKQFEWAGCENYLAFTTAELGEMLPAKIATHKIDSENQYYCCFDNSASPITGISIMEKTEADARAKMLIYLLENKLITI